MKTSNSQAISHDPEATVFPRGEPCYPQRPSPPRSLRSTISRTDILTSSEVNHDKKNQADSYLNDTARVNKFMRC